jgi:hypothetical protein
LADLDLAREYIIKLKIYAHYLNLAMTENYLTKPSGTDLIDTWVENEWQ